MSNARSIIQLDEVAEEIEQLTARLVELRARRDSLVVELSSELTLRNIAGLARLTHERVRQLVVKARKEQEGG